MSSEREAALASEPAPTMASEAEPWIIQPKTGTLGEKLRELWRYRHLWWYFASENLKSQYRKTTLGWFWMLMRIASTVGLSSIIFGGVLAAPSDGPPYFLFFVAGTATWTLFDRSLLFVTRSLERNRKLVTKVYFPRMILPLAATGTGIAFFVITLVVMIGATGYFRWTRGVWYVVLGPRLIVALLAAVAALFMAVSVGLWTSVLQLRWRDVRQSLRYAMPFWFYLTPIIYPMSHIPEKYHWFVRLNPMSSIVEAFKWGTIGTGSLHPQSLVISSFVMTAVFLGGVWFFSRAEAQSIDKL